MKTFPCVPRVPKYKLPVKILSARKDVKSQPMKLISQNGALGEICRNMFTQVIILLKMILCPIYPENVIIGAPNEVG